MAINDFFDRFINIFRKFFLWLCQTFHFWNLSSWLAAFTFVPVVLFLPSSPVTVYYANSDCLSSTEFLILLVWPWCIQIVYSGYFWFSATFWVSLMLFSFYLSFPKYYRSLHLTLVFVGIYSATAFILVVALLSNNSSNAVNLLDEEYQTCFSQLLNIDCLYNYWLVVTSHIVMILLIVSYLWGTVEQ